MQKDLRILFLTPRFPFPLIGGDRLKPYYILSHLAKHHKVTLVTFYQGKDLPNSHLKEIEKFGVDVRVVLLDPIVAGIKAGLRMPGPNPLEIDYYYSNEFAKVVKELEPEKNFDLSVAFFMRTAEYLKNLKMKKILMAEDCRTIYQKRSFEESQNLKQKLIRKWEYLKLRRYEPNIVNYFDITTLVSQDDIKSMQQQNPGAEYRLLTNGTNLNRFPFHNNMQERKNILFAGKLDIWANQLMIKNIIDNILPLIREKVPDVEFHIAGAKPPHSIMALKSKSVHLHIDVPEMLPYLHSARVFLHPHSGGSGIQNKLLEAMAAGCPVVTTPTGNQGIYAKHEESAMLGNSKEEMARHTIRLLSDYEFARSISFNARQLIENEHTWERVFEQFDDILNELFD